MPLPVRRVKPKQARDPRSLSTWKSLPPRKDPCIRALTLLAPPQTRRRKHRKDDDVADSTRKRNSAPPQARKEVQPPPTNPRTIAPPLRYMAMNIPLATKTFSGSVLQVLALRMIGAPMIMKTKLLLSLMRECLLWLRVARRELMGTLARVPSPLSLVVLGVV